MITKTINLTNENVTLTIYLPDASKEMEHDRIKPGMLVIPGGAYRYCSDREAEPIAFEYIAKGYNAFILRYSLNEDSVFPRPLDDAVEALKLIRANAEEWNTNPDQIAAIGFSAGGHLASALSTISDEKPNACILGYPCIIKFEEEILANPMPETHVEVTPDTPPTFIFAAANDNLVPIEHSLQYALALSKNKVPFELHTFTIGGHGFSTADKKTIGDKEYQKKFAHIHYWVDRSAQWLDEMWGNN